MKRRDFLAATGATVGSAVWWTARRDEATTDEATDGPGATGGEGTTTRPQTMPAYGDDVTRVVESTRDGVSLDGSADQTDGEITFTLRNFGVRPFKHNPYGWQLHKWVDGEWYYLAPQVIPMPLTPLFPTQTREWETRLTPDPPSETGQTPNNSAQLELRGTGGGWYAFGTTGWFDGHGQTIAFADRFWLDTAAVRLTPTGRIESTRWEGDTLVAETGSGSGERYVVERRETPTDADRRITEQVVRTPRRRDALALFDRTDAPRVRLEGYGDTTTGSPDRDRFRYRGTEYVENLDP